MASTPTLSADATVELAKVATRSGFSGTWRVEHQGQVQTEAAMGLAERANGRANSLATRFATASATKGFTALAVLALVQSGELSLDTTARSILGSSLPLIDDGVTIEHLLSHRSGIGDYLDEETLGDIDEHIMGVPVHVLESPVDYLGILDGHRQVYAPGERFAYNNSGFVVLSLLVEKSAGSFHQTVTERVLGPAGITDGGFFRSDDLPADCAIGYLKDGRSNVFHLPVIGGGDGGIYLSLDDMSRFWVALLAGEIVSLELVEQLSTVRSTTASGSSYGLGFWLANNGQRIMLEGMDAGVSFASSFNRESSVSYTVMSNTSGGVWPLVKHLDATT